ncbi:MAG: hypothetical protein COA78_11985 [Blastopirellula sp.]|nr:MAG: hypothetical protein COA78_11985 [Blastopirellula sp.]
MSNIIQARWSGTLLEWYFSGKFWYCSVAKYGSKVNGITCRKSGCGDTKDQAFHDFLNANRLAGWPMNKTI